MVANELSLLLGTEGVESSRLECRKSAVGRGQDGDTVGGVEVVFDLRNDVGASKEADEDAESARFFEDFGGVGGFGASLSFGRRGLDQWDGCWRLSRGCSCLRGRVILRRGLGRRLSYGCREVVANYEEA